MYRIRNGENVYRTVKERIYRSQRIKRISSHTCIGHEVHSRYCVRDCHHFLKVLIIMHEYVNKIICILSYNKTKRTLYRLSFGTKFLSLGYLAA